MMDMAICSVSTVVAPRRQGETFFMMFIWNRIDLIKKVFFFFFFFPAPPTVSSSLEDSPAPQPRI